MELPVRFAAADPLREGRSGLSQARGRRASAALARCASPLVGSFISDTDERLFLWSAVAGCAAQPLRAQGDGGLAARLRGCAPLRRGILRLCPTRLVYLAEARRRRAKDGGPDRDRTGDLMNAIHARSQLRYWPPGACKGASTNCRAFPSSRSTRWRGRRRGVFVKPRQIRIKKRPDTAP